MMIFMKLMPYDEYKKKSWPIPYLFTIQKEHQFLYYFGERHSFDPDDDQWNKLKMFWVDFLQVTQGQKRILFIEGGMPPVLENENQAVSQWGGMGLLRYLAHQAGIESRSPEPDRNHEFTELEKQFPRKKLIYYYFARIVHQWSIKQDPRSDFEKYVTRYLEKYKKTSGWSDVDFSLGGLKEVHYSIFGTDFDENDNVFFSRITDPAHLETIINHVSRASSEIRDEYIVKEIQKFFNEGYSIFIQYGATHAIIQEPLLKELLK